MSYILGINAYHSDSSACILKDGMLLAAAEEERFRRVKHWAGFPSEAICYCLREAGIGLGELHHVAINRDPRANLWRKLQFIIVNRPDVRLVLDRLKNARVWSSITESLGETFAGDTFRGELHHVEHHLAHLASSFLTSPYDEAVVVSVDGFGDFSSAAWGVGRGSEIQVERRVYFPHSLGIFYQAITQYIGFSKYGDEYKMMGLAAYGRPQFHRHMRQMVHTNSDGSYRLNLDYFRHHTDNVTYMWNNCAPNVGPLYTPALQDLLGPPREKDETLTQRHKDLARSAQAMYEEAFFNLLNHAHAKYGIDVLALAGGCALNSVANGKIYDKTPFKRVYIHSAPADAGGAIGAAFITYHNVSKANRDFRKDHAFWGPGFTDEQMEAVLEQAQQSLEQQRCEVSYVNSRDHLCRRTASAIDSGKVVGWFQGRMEWGPRALGNRSILCDPRRSDMKDILNQKIKRRESFRPFAPSILRDAVAEWFETDDDVPFMIKVFQIREHKRALIPAVTHVDGSGRLQTVDEESNSLYYQLIKSFCDLTGVPIVLNTSFNENEPVVCRPKEALDCFLRTQMDVLVLGNYFVRRGS